MCIRDSYYTDHFNPNFKKTADLVAIARADGAVGATVNIDLKTGDTASATLSTDYYLAKEGMSYPLDVEGGAGAAFTTAIKSVQRGYVTSTSASFTVSIAAVNTEKAFLNFSTNRAYSGTFQAGVHPRGTLSDGSTITFNRGGTSTQIYVAWEVIEYV